MLGYLSLEQIEELDELQIQQFGGLNGPRDQGALSAAASRPAMTSGGEDLYPDMAAKAAALMHSLVMNHPLVDGNKRAGAAAAEFFVERNGYRMNVSDSEFEEMTLSVARGEIDAESLAIWFRQRVTRED